MGLHSLPFSSFYAFTQAMVTFTKDRQTGPLNILRSTVGEIFGQFSENGKSYCLPIKGLPLVSGQLMDVAKREIQGIKFEWDGYILSASLQLKGGAANNQPIIPITDSTKAAELTASLQEAVDIGANEKLKNIAINLLDLSEIESPKNPTLVIGAIVNALCSDNGQLLELSVKRLLAETLHAYVDLAHLIVTDDKVMAAWKNGANDRINELVTLCSKKSLEETSFRYAVKSAKAGINALKDNNENDVLFSILIDAIQGAYNQDIGSLLTVLQQAVKEWRKVQAGFWYTDLLVIRLLSRLALREDEVFDEIIKMGKEHTSWKYQCGYLKILSQILRKNPSSEHAEEAFTILQEKASFNSWRNSNSWRIREVACEELIYLTRISGFEERAVHTLFDRKQREKVSQVKSRIDSSVQTLQLKDDRDLLLLTKEYKIFLENQASDIGEQKKQIEEERKRLVDEEKKRLEEQKNNESISQDDYLKKIQALKDAEEELDEDKQSVEELLSQIRETLAKNFDEIKKELQEVKGNSTASVEQMEQISDKVSKILEILSSQAPKDEPIFLDSKSQVEEVDLSLEDNLFELRMQVIKQYLDEQDFANAWNNYPSVVKNGLKNAQNPDWKPPKQLFSNLLKIAPWIKSCRKTPEYEKIYETVLITYGQVLDLVEKYQLEAEFSELYKEASVLLSYPLMEMVQKEKEPTLEKVLQVREHYCSSEEILEGLRPVLGSMLSTFKDTATQKKLLLGQAAKFSPPCVKGYRNTLNDWTRFFSLEGTFKSYSDLYGDRKKAVESFVSILGNPYAQPSLLVSTAKHALRIFLKNEVEIPLVEFFFHKLAFFEDHENVERFSPCIEGAVKHLLGKNGSAEEHEKLYRCLSSKSLLEPLRETYINSLPAGPLRDQLALIPNRSGFRQSMRIEQQELLRQIEAITQLESSSVEVKSPLFSKPRFLKPAYIKTLLDEKGDIQPNLPKVLKRRHAVHHLSLEGVDLHLKQKPDHPMQEYAVYSLTARVAGKGVPPSCLVRFDVTLPEQKTKSYPVLVSQTVKGENLEKVLEKDPKAVFSSYHLTHMLLLGLLTRPGDGRPPNYTVMEGEIFCVDNDVSFVEPLVKKLIGCDVNFRSILYCLELQTLDPKAIEEWMVLSPDLLLAGWIQDLVEREEVYAALFNEEERKALYEEDNECKFIPSLLLPTGTFTTLYAQLIQLQDALKKSPSLNNLSLLNHLITLRGVKMGVNQLGESLHYFYNKGRKANNPADRLQIATDTPIGQSLSTQAALKAMIGTVPSFQKVEEWKTLDQLQKELMTFGLNKRNSILITTKEGKMALEVNFSSLVKEGRPDVEMQEHMLRALKIVIAAKQPEYLTFSYVEALTNEILLSFIHDKLAYLKIKSCPNLKSFGPPGLLQNFPLVLPITLKELYIEECDKITSVNIEALGLNVLSLTNNKKLVKGIFNSSLETVIEDEGSPLIRFNFPNVEKLLRKFPDGLPISLGYQIFGRAKNHHSGKGRTVAMYPFQTFFKWLEEWLEEGKILLKSRAISFLKSSPLLFMEFAGVSDAVLIENYEMLAINAFLLSQKKIGNDKIRAISEFLLSQKQITSLKLSNNIYFDFDDICCDQIYFDSEGARVLAAIIPQCSLTTLSISDNSIEDEGAAAIIANSKGMVNLIFDQCKLTNKSAEALAAFLPESSLTSLTLLQNAIDDSGAEALVLAIPNSNLTQLRLSEDLLTEMMQAKLRTLKNKKGQDVQFN